MKRYIVLLLVWGASVTCACLRAHATNYYVDCNYGSNGNLGNSTQAAWRTPLEITLHSANGTFQPGDSIYLKRDCTWYEGFSLSSSGASGSNIVVDSYSNTSNPASPAPAGSGRPPHLTGYLPIADAYWALYSGSVWVSKPLFDNNGSGNDNCWNDSNCVPCPVQGTLYSCLSQPLTAMTAVRFGTVWGNGSFGSGGTGGATSISGLANDRDWFFDPNAQLLYVYCGECSSTVKPPDFYGAVVPIVSPTTMLNLNGVQNIQAQHLLIDWFTGYGIQVQGPSDHLWLANIAANSEVENSTTPIGFWVHSSIPATDTHLFNTEGLFGRQSGREKKDSAMSFVLAALHLRELVASGEVVDEERFKEGLSKMIDGVVECLNASSWANGRRWKVRKL